VNQLAPLCVAIPLVIAALLTFAGGFLSRIVVDLIATLTALASLVMTILLLVHVSSGLEVYWFADWRVTHGVAVGIDFAVGPIGAGLAAFVSLLMVLALVSGIRGLDVKHPYYQVLMLTFLAGMVGFCLSGDLFNMFVLFELMSISAVALVGYKVQEQAALEGGLNFAVINTIGGFLFLLGIGLVYSRTGALNLAQIGHYLAHSGNDRVVVVAFALIASGLLIKAAVVPFHFWMADAYAVALTPVCLLLAGAMSELGLYGLGRIYFSAFQPALAGHTAVLRAIFVGIGLLTSLWGGLMALAEDHLKRLLAFVTIAFIGVFLTGLGLLTADGVAGTAVYVLADGFGKALLFACAGMIQHRLGHLSQSRLHGLGRPLRVIGALFLAGGLLIASIPPFGPFLGKSMIEDAAVKAGYGFVPPFVVLSSALCGAAVLRAYARVFLGWGKAAEAKADDADRDTRPEAQDANDQTPLLQLLPACVLLAGAIGVGVWFGFADLAETAADRFTDVHGYMATVLSDSPHLLAPGHSSSPEWFDWLYCGAATLASLAFAAAGLWGRRYLPRACQVTDTVARALRPLRRTHSGQIGDYTAALTLGVGVFGGLLAITLL
jgi:multicomponent Na+:H+ antiporter subunit D